MSSKTPITIESLEPKCVWKQFTAIAAIPRPSKREAKICAHVVSVAKQLGLKSKQDSAGNIVIEVPPTAGHEQAPITVLQGHVDMVPEKNAGTAHDFEKDPISLIVDADADGKAVVRAAGTTLGADNGIGVAMALAVAADPSIVHGPLELLFTTDEEEGMTGAKALSGDSFKGRRLLNLDSEEDDALYMGCAGGCDTNLEWSFGSEPLPTDGELCRIAVSGLRGGHSGGDIHESRGSATKLLTRVLVRSRRDDLRLVCIEGGSKRNAIAREASAVVCGNSGILGALIAAAKEVEKEAREESVEEKVRIVAAAADGRDARMAISAEDSALLLAALSALPHGVLGMHPRVPGLVQTSNNLGIIGCEQSDDGKQLRVRVATLTRSSSESRIDETLEQISCIGKLSGARASTGNRYPGWEPNPDSPVLGVCRGVYKELFSEEPHVAAIHAGLECGIIGERLGGMDMVSFGPRIEGPHSPDERVWVESVQKTWKYLLGVLESLAGCRQ